MFRKAFLILMMIWIFLPENARAEYLDYTQDRQAYAEALHAVSAELSTVPRGDAQAALEPRYTLVMIRMSEGEPDFGAYAPDVLLAAPQRCYTAAYLDPEKAGRAIDRLRQTSGVVYAEADGEVTACVTQEDFHSYGAQEMGFDVACSWAGQVGVGSATIAVIDSGVIRHPFLLSRLTASGYDYVDGDTDATNDGFGHGTHVAGIIADCTPQLPVFIRSIRVLNASGRGSKANTVSAIFEAVESGCQIINLSLVSQSHSDALEDAVRSAIAQGVTVVISAGNQGESVNGYCPVHMDDAGLLVVGACSDTLAAPQQAPYSNYGPSVDVYAFGTNILSCSISGGYSYQSGTSQAAPHISAACAVIRLLHPGIDPVRTETIIRELAGDGEVNVPDLSRLIPETLGCTAQRIILPVGHTVQLLRQGKPAASRVNLTWGTEDASVAYVDDDGVLHCIAEGSTLLTGDAPANADVQLTLTVMGGEGVFALPEGLSELETEALAGTAAAVAVLPESLEHLGADVFTDTQITTLVVNGEVPDAEQLAGIPGITVLLGYQSGTWRELEKLGVPSVLDYAR